MNPLDKFTDRELFFHLFREYEPHTVKEFAETVTTTLVTDRYNNTTVKSTTNTQNERVEFGALMDLHTKYAEFDKDGRLVYIGQSMVANY